MRFEILRIKRYRFYCSHTHIHIKMTNKQRMVERAFAHCSVLNVSADSLLKQTINTHCVFIILALNRFLWLHDSLSQHNCTFQWFFFWIHSNMYLFLSLSRSDKLTDVSWSSVECVESRFLRSFSPDDVADDVDFLPSFSRSDFFNSLSRFFSLRSFSFLAWASSKSLKSSSQSRFSAGSHVLSFSA